MTALLSSVVVLAALVVLTRRRSIAIAAVSLQTFLLAVISLWNVWPIHHGADIAPAAALMVRGVLIAGVLAVAAHSTRESAPVRPAIEPPVRMLITIGAVIVIVVLLPGFGLRSMQAQDTSVALLVIGIIVLLTRRATVLQVIGILTAENAVALAAISSPQHIPLIVELGLVFDLVLLTTVAAVFHQKIFEEFGAGDTSMLEELRD